MKASEVLKINPNSNQCQYIIDKDKRKIICVIKNTKSLVYRFIDGLGYDPIDYYWISDLIMPSTFSGVATCSPYDEWDEELGKRLAFARAKYKVDRSFFKRANKLINELDDKVNQLYTAFNDCGADLSERHRHREEVIGKRLNDTAFRLYKPEYGYQ